MRSEPICVARHHGGAFTHLGLTQYKRIAGCASNGLTIGHPLITDRA